jgi:hypothetical protein
MFSVFSSAGDPDPDPQDPHSDPQDPHFLGLPDPHPFVRGTDPAPAPDLPFSHKCVERTKIMSANSKF